MQGTTWQNPPILQGPTRDETVNGKQLMLFANGGQAQPGGMAAPRGAVYWVSNSLTDSIGNRQLVGIAASLTRGGGK